ncbi:MULTISPECIES: DUF2960 family protein [Aliagarivorans]|uniref:DUF2960 family protein n=1 Tax=Aliagarivorans TaxID=882379 RepID=UPI000423255E|nr:MULTISPECIES: DUF2960 family protein [Aliagarivorans]
MARLIHYRFKGQEKTISFANDRFHDLHQAVAAAEGVDLTQYLAMERQVEQTTRGGAALRQFRDAEFKRMGFTDIRFEKK